MERGVTRQFGASAYVMALFLLFTKNGLCSLPTAEVLSKSPQWLARLHVRLDQNKHPVSEVDGPQFFLSSDGKTNPLHELHATLKALSNRQMVPYGDKQEPAACVFPERKRFLEGLGFQFPEEHCPRLTEWLTKMRGQQASLIFAAPYFGSPSSLFGHTFLRIHRGGSPLLDAGISFEAFTGGDTGAGYVLKGLVGAYPGLYGTTPFHMKLNVYQNVESRDLWDYPLGLSPDQVEKLLLHLWEMGTTHLNYYFFDENCSYHLLGLLDAIDPELRRRENFGWKAIPADTIRVSIASRGAGGGAGAPKLWPSAISLLRRRLKWLTPQERERFFSWRKGEYRLKAESTQLIDAMIDWARISHGVHSRTLFDPDYQVPHDLLLARSRAQPSTATQVEITNFVEPELWDADLVPDAVRV